jgi:hypothetical protein
LSHLNRICNGRRAKTVTGKNDNAEIQALYREVNERIAHVSRAMDVEGKLEILCECGAAACTERVELDPAEYEDVRAHATHFALLDGHQDRTVEHVVRAHEGFLVVANYGAAATVARRTDPRPASR